MKVQRLAVRTHRGQSLLHPLEIATTVLVRRREVVRLHQIISLVNALTVVVRLRPKRGAVRIVDQDRSGPRQHIVRVLAEVPSSAFLQVSAIRPVRGCAWKSPPVRLCCRRRCRQTAARVRSVEWALAGVLPGLGSGMVRGPYAGPATRAGRDPARNLNEWPPGLARRGPEPGRWVKPTEPTGPTSGPSPRPTTRRHLAVGLALAARARPASSALPVVRCAVSARPGRWPARGGGAESGPGGRPCRARPASAGRLEDVEKVWTHPASAVCPVPVDA